MIIRTDLNQILREEERVERNPLPAFLTAAGIIILTGICTHNWLLQRNLDNLRGEAERLQQKADEVSRELAAAKSAAPQQAAVYARRQSLITFAKQRLNWAPLLEIIFSATPKTIQLSSLEGSVPWQREVSLRIAGTAFAGNPRMECDKFRLLLLNLFEKGGLKTEARFEQLQDAESADPNDIAQANFIIVVSWLNENGK